MKLQDGTIIYDRSRTVCDWQCPRKRYWQYEWGGTGVVGSTTGLELYLGIALHDGLAAIATQQATTGVVDIEAIAQAAWKQIYDALSSHEEGELIEDIEFAKEQATLVEGLLRGFHRHQWPLLMQQYPHIRYIEQESEYRYGQVGKMLFMSKPDLVVEDRDGDLWYCVDPHSKVLTKQLTWVKAGDVKLGQELVGFDEEKPANKLYRQWANTVVTGVATLQKTRYRVTLDNGTAVVCSDDHKWLTKNGWRETKDLIVGVDSLHEAVEPWYSQLNKWDPYEQGYLGAALDGEGSLVQRGGNKRPRSRNTVLSFPQKPNPMFDRVQQIYRKYCLNASDPVRAGYKDGFAGVLELRTTDRAEILKILGISNPIRIMAKFDLSHWGSFQARSWPKVTKLENIGVGAVVSIATSTKTLIVEGLASHNCEYKSTSSKKEEWINSWTTAVQLHSTIKAIEESLKEKITGVIVQGLYKGYVSYGKQNSPFCYCYRKFGNPPFSETQTEYEYKAGFKRYPVWELEGGCKKWVEDMPPHVLANQFPQAPPIFVRDALVQAFFRQREIREIDIACANKLLEGADPESVTEILNEFYPQRFDQCVPSFGRPCSYLKLCHGATVEDPIALGFVRRESHHELERVEQERKHEKVVGEV